MAPKDNTSLKAANTLLNNRLMAYSVIAGAVLGNTAAKATVQKTTPIVTLDTNGETFNVVFGGETKFRIQLNTNTSKYVNTTTTTTTSTVTHVKTHFGGYWLPTYFSSTWIPTSYPYTTKQYYPNVHSHVPVSTITYTNNSLGVLPQTVNAGFAYSANYARALSTGVTVGSSVAFTHSGAAANMGDYYGNNGPVSLNGQFPNTTGKFLGLRFQISGTTYYGWVQVDVNNTVSQAIIQSQAWEDIPGLSIITGSDVSLPVQATQVIAESTLRGVILQWGTESELDHLGFVIERRLAGTDGVWELISSYETNSQLKGQGNKSTHTSYQFVDSDVESGLEYEYKVYAVDINGTISSEQIIRVQHTSSLPTEMALFQNYPNPFNPSTHIGFDLPEDTHVKLSVYNASGQVVKVLMDQHMNAGRYIKDFDASDFSAGIYFYELIAGDKRMVRKMHLIK